MRKKDGVLKLLGRFQSRRRATGGEQGAIMGRMRGAVDKMRYRDSLTNASSITMLDGRVSRQCRVPTGDFHEWRVDRHHDLIVTTDIGVVVQAGVEDVCVAWYETFSRLSRKRCCW